MGPGGVLGGEMCGNVTDLGLLQLLYSCLFITFLVLKIYYSSLHISDLHIVLTAVSYNEWNGFWFRDFEAGIG